MDCAKLREDIGRLERVKEALESKSSELSSETSQATLREIRGSCFRTDGIEDGILQEYLPDFVENNVELHNFSFGEAIEGFGEAIASAQKLSDAEVLVCGRYGEVRILHTEDEKYSFGEKIEGFEGVVIDTLKLSDAEILVCGGHGQTRILHKKNEGYSFGEKIEGFEGSITRTLKLSNTEILVCGWGGEIRILRKEGDSYSYGERIWGFEGDIGVAQKLSDTEILISGQGGTGILRLEDGEYRYSESVDGFNGYNSTSATASLKLSDTETLVCGNCGETCILYKDDDGYFFGDDLWAYESSDAITTVQRLSGFEIMVLSDEGRAYVLQEENGDYFYNGVVVEGFDSAILTSCKLSDAEFLVGGARGEARILRRDPVDLDDLKRVLPDISAKRNA